jgi:hypothetical protein
MEAKLNSANDALKTAREKEEAVRATCDRQLDTNRRLNMERDDALALNEKSSTALLMLRTAFSNLGIALVDSEAKREEWLGNARKWRERNERLRKEHDKLIAQLMIMEAKGPC